VGIGSTIELLPVVVADAGAPVIIIIIVIIADSAKIPSLPLGGSVAERLACWTQHRRARVQIAVATLSGNSHRQTVYTHRASVHQSAKLVAALVSVAGVTAGLTQSNGSLPPGL